MIHRARAGRRLFLLSCLAISAVATYAQPYEPDPGFFDETDLFVDLTPTLAARLELFCRDLGTHDYYRVYAYFDPWYVQEQMSMAGGDAPDPAAEPKRAASMILLWSAIMYEEGSMHIEDLDDIVDMRITEIWIDQVFFEATLQDDRVVAFSLFMDRDTYLLSGALG